MCDYYVCGYCSLYLNVRCPYTENEQLDCEDYKTDEGE